MIKVTPLYKEIENGTFKAKQATPVTDEERERIKRNNPNTYKGFTYFTE